MLTNTGLGFFKREQIIGSTWKSPFEVWLAEHVICKLMGHKWEYWSLISRYKCERCLEARPETEMRMGGFTAIEKIKSRVLAPDGKTVLQGREGMALRKKMYGRT